jgi:surfactin synthase thioesterase subunit
MGALTAFEMAKWLEENEVKVKKIIVLDKTAQPEFGKFVEKIDLKPELLEIADQIASDEIDYERITSYLKVHEGLIEAYQQQGFVRCNIDVYYCENGFPTDDFQKWQRFSSGVINLKSIKRSSHYEIPKIWNDLNIEF